MENKEKSTKAGLVAVGSILGLISLGAFLGYLITRTK